MRLAGLASILRRSRGYESPPSSLSDIPSTEPALPPTYGVRTTPVSDFLGNLSQGWAYGAAGALT